MPQHITKDSKAPFETKSKNIFEVDGAQQRTNRILWIWFLRGPNLSTEVSTVRQIKRLGTGMMQLVLQEKEKRRCFGSGAKVMCAFVCIAGQDIYGELLT